MAIKHRVKVVFQVNLQGDKLMIWGQLTEDPKRRYPKVVWIYGYRAKAYEKWEADLPEKGEEWLCLVEMEENPFDPYEGKMFVRLLKNLTDPNRVPFNKKDHYHPLVVVSPSDNSLDNIRFFKERLDDEVEAHKAFKFVSEMIRFGGIRQTKNLLQRILRYDRQYLREIFIGQIPNWKNLEFADWYLGKYISEQTRQKAFSVMIEWLEEKLSMGTGEQVFFRSLDEKNVACSECGNTIKLTRGNLAELFENGELELVCPNCGGAGTFFQPNDPEHDLDNCVGS